MSERNGDILINRFEEEKAELEEAFLSKMFEARVISEKIKVLKETTETPLDNPSDELRSELIHKYVEKVTVKPTDDWGVYELSILYFDMNVDFVTLKSMSKKAYDVLGNEISFDYLERFVRPYKDK